MRILFGLENLPRDPSNTRLPSVTAGPAPLRLNSVPLPTDIAPVEPTHAARRVALLDWLLIQCGDYQLSRRRFVTDYLDWVDAQIVENRDVIESRLARFDGVYKVEDCFWSAPRPLPRAWVPEGDGFKSCGIAFWDGTQVLRIDPAVDAIPESFQRFWEGDVLPMSPFRRPMPALEKSPSP